jgi:glycine/D-amino acid oxidase-like deaminating enzyme
MRHTPHGYWLEEAGERDALPAAEGELEADVLVVGGGYTGMWTAWQLGRLEPEARVVLLEAGRCGYGPSGRNGGFVNGHWFVLPLLRERYGDEAAIAISRAAHRAMLGVGEFCEEQGVDAWYRRAGYLLVSTAPAYDEVSSIGLEDCRELGEADAVVPLSADQVAERCRSPLFRGGALYPGAATVQPARLALGLRDRVAALPNVDVFERSPVRRLRAGPWGCAAETGSARVRAGSGVLAMGGASTGAAGPLRGRLTVTSSHIVITEPVPDLLEEIGWTGGECITDSQAMVHYFRTTPDGRIAFGWGGGWVACGARLRRRTEFDPAVVSEIGATLREFFPGLEGRRITHAWGGPIDVAPTHLPYVTRVGTDRVYAGLGYTGNGVGPSHMLGQVLASLALDRRDEYSSLALVEPSPPRMPTGLTGWLGGNAIRAAVVRLEAARRDGGDGDPLSRALATLPERIGFHIGRV